MTPPLIMYGGKGAQFVANENQSADEATLKGGDGGGTFDSMPPDFPERVATLEANVKNMATSIDRIDRTVESMRGRMDTDFRITWGGLIAVALGLAALMAKGFKWI